MVSPSVQQTLFQAIDDRLQSYLNDWRSFYTSIYTSQEQKIQEAFLVLLHQYGCTTRILDHDHHIIYGESINDTPHTLLFSLQYTSTTSQKGGWQLILPFFSNLVALQIYKTHFGQLPINIKWLLVMGETTSQATLEHLISKERSLLKADSCILYTTNHAISKGISLPELTLGIKGHLATTISIQTASTAIPIHYDAIAPNAAWQLIWALHTVKDTREDILIDGFYDDLMPIEDETIEALKHLPDTSSMMAQTWGTEHLLLNLHGVQQHYAHFLTPTCSIIHLSSDNDLQSMPVTAQAQLDFRLVPYQDPYTIFAKLQQHFLAQSTYPVQLQLRSATYPAYTSIKDPLVQQLQQSMESIYNQAPTIIPLSTEPDIYDMILRTKLTIPTIRVAMPEPSATTPEQEQIHLTQSLKQQILFLASAKNYHPDASNPSSH